MVKANFPEIDYNFWFNNYSWEGFSSMDKMISTMKNKKYISDDITQENITYQIQNKIEQYLIEKSDNLLFEIFKLIQTWGGKSAGKYTLKIVENWEVEKVDDIFKTNAQKYKEFVDLIINNNEILSFYKMTDKSFISGGEENKNYGIKINGLSYSFVPKHICFWSGKGDRTKGLPILDDVIAKIIYKVEKAEKVDYRSFINDMNIFSKKIEDDSHNKIKLTPTQIEMAIFSFTGNYWETQKTATKSLKQKNRIESNDKKIAESIANQGNFNVIEKKIKQTSFKRKKDPQLQVGKNDYIKNKAGNLFLSEVFVNKNKLNKNKIKTNNPVTIKNIKYYEYIGDISLIRILDKI